MRTMITTILGFLLFAAVPVQSYSAEAQEADNKAILDEIKALSEEKKGNSFAVDKSQNPEENKADMAAAAAAPKLEEYQARSSTIVNEWVALEAEYGGDETTVNCRQADGTLIPDCDNRRIANNTLVGLQEEAGRILEQIYETQDAEGSAAIARKLERNRYIDARISFLNGRLAELRGLKTGQDIKTCLATALQGSLDGLKAREAECWDNARSPSATVESATGRIEFDVAERRRRAEDAIKEYLGSGGPQTGFKPRPVPRPTTE